MCVYDLPHFGEMQLNVHFRYLFLYGFGEGALNAEDYYKLLGCHI